MNQPPEFPWAKIPFGKALAKSQGLSRLRLAMLCRQYKLDAVPEATAYCPAYLLLGLWVAELLAGTFLTEPQQIMLLDKLQRPLEHCLDGFAVTASAGRLKSPHLLWQIVFTDGQYATYTGAEHFVDLTTGDPITPPRPPLESISYNITELFLRRLAEVQEY